MLLKGLSGRLNGRTSGHFLEEQVRNGLGLRWEKYRSEGVSYHLENEGGYL